MIKNYVILDAAGIYPIGAGANFSVPIGAIEVNWDAFNYACMMFIEGVWIHRPRITAPLVGVNRTVVFPDAPTGTIITVVDQQTREILAVTEETTLVFSDSADYSIKAVPPLPYMSWTGVVSC